VQWSLWPRLSWTVSLALMYNLTSFTDIWLLLSLTNIVPTHDTTLDYVMKSPLKWTACTAVAPWIFTNWVLADTTDIPKVFIFFSQFCRGIQTQCHYGPRSCYWTILPIRVCQPTDQRYVVGQHHEKKRGSRTEETKGRGILQWALSVKLKLV